MKEKIHNILNKDIKKYDMKLLLTVCFIFIALVAFISYKISSSYALFTDEVNGSFFILLFLVFFLLFFYFYICILSCKLILAYYKLLKAYI